jgi:hypothetical protein
MKEEEEKSKKSQKKKWVTATCVFTGFTSSCLRHFEKITVPNPSFNENDDASDPQIRVFKVKGYIPQKFLDKPLYLNKSANTNWFAPK